MTTIVIGRDRRPSRRSRRARGSGERPMRALGAGRCASCSPAPHSRTCPPRGTAYVWDARVSGARAEREAARSARLLCGPRPACLWGVGCALLQCHRSADTRLERYRLPAMLVGRAGPCSRDPCHCSVLLAGSRGRDAPPGTHVPPSGASEVVRNEYNCSLD